MNPDWTLQNKKAIVTGGSKGIGYAIVKELLDAGAEVLMIARDISIMNIAKDELKPGIGKLSLLDVDVSKSKELNRVGDFVQTNWGSLDILINNVGTNIRKKAEEYSADETDHIINTNLKSAFGLSTLLFPFLKESQLGNIVNISSVAGLGHLKTGIMYGMSKAAINQMTKNLAAEWAEYNIRVNAIVPWYIDTPLAKQVLKNPDYLSEVIARTPMKRIGKPEEVASLARFLCLPVAGYITGQCISVDGGFSINMF